MSRGTKPSEKIGRGVGLIIFGQYQQQGYNLKQKNGFMPREPRSLSLQTFVNKAKGCPNTRYCA